MQNHGFYTKCEIQSHLIQNDSQQTTLMSYYYIITYGHYFYLFICFLFTTTLNIFGFIFSQHGHPHLRMCSSPSLPTSLGSILLTPVDIILTHEL